jgi:hypothetical protein
MGKAIVRHGFAPVLQDCLRAALLAPAHRATPRNPT